MAGRERPVIPLPFALEIPWVPPTVNRWVRLHFRPKKDVLDVAYMAIVAAVMKADVMGMKFRTPVDIHVDIYKKGPKRYADAHNYTTPIDKCFVDALTSQRGRKRRGLGLIPDDTPEYVRLFTPTVHEGADRQCTVLTFRPSPEGAVHENQNDQPPARKNPRRNSKGKA